MDPLTSLLESLDQAASTRSPSAQDVLAHANASSEQVAPKRTTTAPSEQVAPERTTTAPSEQVAPQRTTNAPPELVVPRRTTSAPIGNEATNDVADDADGEESSLSPASPEIVQRPRCNDHVKSYYLNHNQMHKSIPSFSFKATVTKPRSSSSSSSSSRVRINQVAPTIPLTRIGATSERLGRYGDRGTMEPAATGRLGGNPPGALSRPGGVVVRTSNMTPSRLS